MSLLYMIKEQFVNWLKHNNFLNNLLYFLNAIWVYIDTIFPMFDCNLSTLIHATLSCPVIEFFLFKKQTLKLICSIQIDFVR